MTLNDSEQIDTVVRPALAKSYVYDVSDSDAAELLNGGTIWARIMGESANIHLRDIETGNARVVMGWAR